MSWVYDELDRIERSGRMRDVRAVVPSGTCRVEIDGRPIHLFSGNDYLGLSSHPAVASAAARAAERFGMGPRGSALVCGYTAEHEALESELAALKGAETALLFPTGYQANLGVLSALGSSDTTFFSDALNHASIIDGCRLAHGAVEVFRHRDPDDLDRLLQASNSPRKIIVTDTVFSMDGTIAPLSALVELKDRHGAILVADEAHATLVYGESGGGIAQAQDVESGVDFHVGTLSKAVGAVGGFVATSAERRRWLLNTARSFIFTTALPLPVVAAARAALDTAADGGLRTALWERVAQLSTGLQRPLESPIASVIVGEEKAAVAAGCALLEAGFHAPAIRPPTVPDGTSRIRIALSAGHDVGAVSDLLDVLRKLGLLDR